jgi:hypothetical protein
MWLPKETFLTKLSQLQYDYLSKFEVICKNSMRCETVAQGKMIDEETEVKNLMKLSLEGFYIMTGLLKHAYSLLMQFS